MNLQLMPQGDVFKYKSVLRQNLPAPANFTAASNTQSFTLFGLPAGFVLVGVRLLLVSKFVAFGMSSLQCILGASGATNYLMPAFECTQVPSDTTFKYWSAFGEYTSAAYDVIATFTSVGAQLNTMTAGELAFTFLYRSL